MEEAILKGQKKDPDPLAEYVLKQIMPAYPPTSDPGFWRTTNSRAVRWVCNSFSRNKRLTTPARDFHFNYDFVVPYWHGRVDKSVINLCCVCFNAVVEGVRDETATQGKVLNFPRHKLNLYSNPLVLPLCYRSKVVLPWLVCC